VHCRIWCSALVVMAVVMWSWNASCVHCESYCSTVSCWFLSLHPIIRLCCVWLIHHCIFIYVLWLFLSNCRPVHWHFISSVSKSKQEEFVKLAACYLPICFGRMQSSPVHCVTHVAVLSFVCLYRVILSLEVPNYCL